MTRERGLTRLMKKRELLSYYLLCMEEGRVWNVGEAVDELVSKLGMSRKVAFSIIRRFRRIGLLVRAGDLDYRCYGFLRYIKDLYESYAERRRLVRKVAFKNLSSAGEKESR